MDYFIGTILLVAFNFCPQGFVPCDGRLLTITQNQALFSLILNTYGGDGRTTFAVPNLNGRVPVGVGPGYNLGQTGGSNTITLAPANLPAHTHTVTADVKAAKDPGTRSVPQPGDYLAAGKSASPSQPKLYRADAPSGTVSLNAGTATGSTGTSQSIDNMQPYIAMQYVICVQGIYPPRQ